MRKLLPLVPFVLCVLITSAALPGAANAQTTAMGADLNRPLNTVGGSFGADGVNCPETIANYFEGQLPSVGPYPATPTCTWTSGADSGLLVPSGVGVISQVQIRTGPVTGPMRITVMSASRHALSSVAQCCFFKSETDVFVPPADTVATIPTSIPVSNTLNSVANTYNFDLLGLTVLDAATTIPLHIQVPDAVGGPFSSAYYPHVGPSATDTPRVDGASAGGTVLLMAAAWQSCGGMATTTSGGARQASVAGCPSDGSGGGGSGPPPPSGGGIAKASDAVGVSGSRVKVGARDAFVPIRCKATTECGGRVMIESGRRAGAAGRKAFGSVKFKVEAGKTKKVRVKLTSEGRRFAHRRGAKAWVNVKLDQPTASGYASKRVSLLS